MCLVCLRFFDVVHRNMSRRYGLCPASWTTHSETVLAAPRNTRSSAHKATKPRRSRHRQPNAKRSPIECGGGRQPLHRQPRGGPARPSRGSTCCSLILLSPYLHDRGALVRSAPRRCVLPQVLARPPRALFESSQTADSLLSPSSSAGFWSSHTRWLDAVMQITDASHRAASCAQQRHYTAARHDADRPGPE